MKQNKLAKFINQVLITFATMIIVMSVAGWIVVNSIETTMQGLFGLVNKGIAYATLLQFFLLSLIVNTFGTLLLPQLVKKKKSLLWKQTISFWFTVIIGVIFIIVFDWFPSQSFEAWVGYFTSIGVIFIITIIVLKTKMYFDDKKYYRLLLDYKIKQNKERGDDK